MGNYSVTGNGEKIHLRAIKEIYLKNGIPKVKYRGRESSYAPYKTSCGRYDNGSRSVDMVRFFELKKDGADLCKKCAARYKAALEEGRKLKRALTTNQ